MRVAKAVITRANRLVKKYKTRDPFVIAELLGIHVIWTDEFTKLKGMYTIQRGERFIFISSKLDEMTAAIVCAHEIGHDQFHRQLAMANGIQEFGMYDMSVRSENEANSFAAALLLDGEVFLDYVMNYHYDARQVAQAMNTDINLIPFKVAGLSAEGHDLNLLESRSDFLK